MSAARVVVGWDGSDVSEDAVRVAVAEAARRQGALEVVLVWDLLTQPGEFSPQFDQAAAERAVAEAAQRLVPPDRAPTVATRALLGQAAGGLIEAAEGADLLVLGRHGRGRAFDRLLGSVTEMVLHHARCPVMVVPPSGAGHGS